MCYGFMLIRARLVNCWAFAPRSRFRRGWLSCVTGIWVWTRRRRSFCRARWCATGNHKEMAFMGEATIGQPFIPVMRPWLDEREVEAARRPILSGWVTQGPEVAAFEREFAE